MRAPDGFLQRVDRARIERSRSPRLATEDLGNSHPIFVFGEFELDLALVELRHAGMRVQIDPKPFAVLAYLIAHRDRVVSKRELLEQCWPDVVVEEGSVFRAVKELRARLQTGDSPESWIETLRRRGYRFTGSVGVRLPGLPNGASGTEHRTRRAIYGLPRHPSMYFVGRAEELVLLERLLAGESYISVQVAIEGLAGIGKTELALHLAHKLGHAGAFPGGVFWLDAENRDLSSTWGSVIADQCDVPAAPLAQRSAEVVRRLEERSARLLIVLDNVVSWKPEARPGPLPSGSHVQMLVTTRTRNLGGTRFKHLELDMLEQPSDRELVVEVAGRDPEPGLLPLLTHLGGHALALELAGSFFRTYPQESAGSYLDALQHNADSVEREVKEYVSYERTVGQAFQLIWDRMPDALRRSWCTAAVFEPAPVTQDLLMATGIDAETLRTLQDLHLIRCGEDARWSMHRLVRAFGQSGEIPPEQRRAARAAFAAGCLAYVRPILRWDAFRDYAPNRAHLDAALGIGFDVWGERSRDLADLQYRVGFLCDAIGDFPGAVEIFQQAAVTYRAYLHDHPDLPSSAQAKIRQDLGCALLGIGERQSTTQALQEAVTHLRVAVENDASGVGRRWGLLADFARALSLLGVREAGTARLEEALDAYHSLLEVISRTEQPLEWATTQNNLANTLVALVKREFHGPRFDEAISAYCAALEERTRERVPVDWATTQTNLGNALLWIGERESNSHRLDDAIRAYRAALEERTRDRVPLRWATTQANLAAALSARGTLALGTSQLEEAVEVFTAVLEVCARDRMPTIWAMTQYNLGDTLVRVAKRLPSGTTELRRAVQSLHAALEEWSRDQVPRDWALAQYSLGEALLLLGEREGQASLLDNAIQVLRAGLDEGGRDRSSFEWAQAQTALGHALCILGSQEQRTAHLDAAVAAIELSLEGLSRTSAPVHWAMAQSLLGEALMRRGERERDSHLLERAVSHCRAALEEATRERAPWDWTVALRRLALTLWKLGERSSGTAQLIEAATLLHQVRAAYNQAELKEWLPKIDHSLMSLDRQILDRQGRRSP